MSPDDPGPLRPQALRPGALRARGVRPRAIRLDDPRAVEREYAREDRLATRKAAYRNLRRGPDAEEVAFEALARIAPRRALEVGCGSGELAERIARDLRCSTVAVDIAPRMVELARARGVDARLGDAQRLPFANGEFDCAVASWMLYHLPDLDRGLAELARVLRPGGRLVAVTFGEENLKELWRLLGDESAADHPFSSENGGERLQRHFARVERRAVEAVLEFPDPAAVRRYVAATIRRAHLAERVPPFEGPFRARTSHAVFVAETPC